MFHTPVETRKGGLEEQLGSNTLWQEGWEKRMGKGTKERYRAIAVMSAPGVCRVASLSHAPFWCNGTRKDEQ